MTCGRNSITEVHKRRVESCASSFNVCKPAGSHSVLRHTLYCAFPSQLEWKSTFTLEIHSTTQVCAFNANTQPRLQVLHDPGTKMIYEICSTKQCCGRDLHVLHLKWTILLSLRTKLLLNGLHGADSIWTLANTNKSVLNKVPMFTVLPRRSLGN